MRMTVGVRTIDGIRHADYDGAYILIGDSETEMVIETIETVETLAARQAQSEALIDAMLGVQE